MTNPERLEQSAEKMNISSKTECNLGRCATCAYAMSCPIRAEVMAGVVEDGVDKLSELNSFNEATEMSLRHKTEEDVIKDMIEAFGSKRTNEIFAKYVEKVVRPMPMPKSIYESPRDHFKIPNAA